MLAFSVLAVAQPPATRVDPVTDILHGTAIVDPYRYRAVYTQPKLIILGTNDPYWPLDALNLYYDDLPGEKYILYCPNNVHGLKDYARIFGSLSALHHKMISSKKLPKMKWDFAESHEDDAKIQSPLALHCHLSPPVSLRGPRGQYMDV